MYDVIILGGGASALFLAQFLEKKRVLILEHNKRLGEKLRVSGGGKCNITNENLSFLNYYPKHSLIKDVLRRANNKDLLRWIKNKKLKVIKRERGEYFFNSSKDILKALKPKCEVILNCEILRVDNNFNVITNRGTFSGKNIVVALGGASFRKLGATKVGYEIAKSFLIDVKPIKPALVGLTLQPMQEWFKKLSGISFIADVYVNNKKFSQNILFAHRGISGPAILNASLYWERGEIIIDFLASKRVKELLRDKDRQIISQLPLPKRFIKEFLSWHKIEDKKIKYLSAKEWEILEKLERYSFAPAGTFGFEKAEVTKGGVSLEEIEWFMESKKKRGLFFIGEVLDATGELGGYNLQWAFSSAYCAALRLNDKL